MAKKSEGRPKGARRILDAAKRHLDALQAKGLSVAVLDRYETALAGIENEHRGPNAAAQTLMRDIARSAADFQAALRKEFPGNASFLSLFRAGEPIPADARGLLGLGRQIVAEAPGFSANLVRHAISSADSKHLASLCDQLERELGGVDPRKAAEELEAQIRAAARAAFEGKPELAEFE